MAAFDAADRSYCTARRQSTSTPLQSLALLNDPQIVEAARFIAQRMLGENPGRSDEMRAACMFRLITGRAATQKELAVLEQTLAEQRALLAADPGAAAKLLQVGEAKHDAGIDTIELAANTVLAIALLNHDAAVMRR
jgi:hypothetical protein